MIGVFHKMRQKLLAENRFYKYLSYASGEIILVVIGILIALQINNWNERNKQEERFYGLLNQIYNAIFIDYQWQLSNREDLIMQAAYVDTILTSPEKYDSQTIVHMLYYINLEPSNSISKTRPLLQYLDFNAGDEKQRNLTKLLVSFAGDMFVNQYFNEISDENNVITILQKNNIPEAPLVFGFSSYHQFSNIIKGFYKENEIATVLQLLKSPALTSALRTLQTRKINQIPKLNLSIAECENYLERIKSAYPTVQLSVSEIGIVGSALPTGWDVLVPMVKKNKNENIWETTQTLNSGILKFKNGNSWSYNWGGRQFPEGTAYFYAQDIPVQQGTYKIVLDLDKNTYQFIKIK